MAVGREGLASAGLGLARLKLWGALSFLFGGRRALFYSITTRRLTHPEEFKADMAELFELLRIGAIHPVVVDRLPLAAAREVHVAHRCRRAGRQDCTAAVARQRLLGVRGAAGPRPCLLCGINWLCSLKGAQ